MSSAEIRASVLLGWLSDVRVMLWLGCTSVVQIFSLGPRVLGDFDEVHSTCGSHTHTHTCSSNKWAWILFKIHDFASRPALLLLGPRLVLGVVENLKFDSLHTQLGCRDAGWQCQNVVLARYPCLLFRDLVRDVLVPCIIVKCI